MSNNNRDVQAGYGQGGFTSDTATNLGRQQAEQNVPLAPQQHNEPAELWQKRQAEHDWTKKQNGG